jgi:hypothetical protein
MSKYTIEGNINFYDELFKSLDDIDSDDDTTLCQITSLPLVDKSVTLECSHHFNYDALYREICRQKFYFKTYDVITLTKTEKQKFNDSALDYFIKCPYCRSIQFTILPYYEELALEKKYGINSLDKSLPNSLLIYNDCGPYYGSDNYIFNMYGQLFKKGQCCSTLCQTKYVAAIPGTTTLYCKLHYRNAIKLHKVSLKNLALADKNKQKEDKLEEMKKIIDERKKIIDERKKIFDERNAERATKGLPPLKRLPIIKKKLENEIQESQPIGQYVPDVDEQVKTGCTTILKSGPNKGTQCCCKTVNENGICKRHVSKDLKI